MLQKCAKGICGTNAEGIKEAEPFIMTYKSKVFCVNAMKTNKGLEVWLQPFLISTLDGGDWLISRPGPFTSRRGSPYFLSRKVGRPQSHFERFGEHKNLLHLPGFEPRIVHPERNRYTFAPSKKKIIWMVIVMWLTMPGDFTHVGGIGNVCTVFTANVKRCPGISERR